MQVSVEATDGLERRMTVAVPAAQLNQEVDKRLNSLTRTVRIKGFRPGKVPLSVVRRQYGGQVNREVVAEMIQSSFREALGQENLVPAGEPTIEATGAAEDGNFEYTATFEVFPEIALGNFDQISVKRPVVEVTDADVDRMIGKLQRQRVTWRETERPAQEGDQVTVDYQGFIDGEAFEGGSRENATVEIGAGRFIEGFESGLIGSVTGDDRVLNLKFPDDYREQAVAGRDVEFKVAIRAVSEPVTPEVDGEFVRSFGVESGEPEAFRSEIRNNMKRELDQAVRARVKQQIMDGLRERNPVTLPNVLVEAEIQRMRQQMGSSMSGQVGAKQIQQLPKEIFRDQAEKRVSLGLLIGEYIKQNGIKVDQDRLRKTVEEIAEPYEDPASVVNWYYADKERLSNLESAVLEDQVVDSLLGQAQVEEQAMSFEELMEPGK